MTNMTTAARLAQLRAASAGVSGRDPRVPPTKLFPDISVPESCRFYGVEDGRTTCRVPRSCQDCLRKPGCAVTQDGRCDNVTEPWMDDAFKFDYHNMLMRGNPHGDAFNRTILKSDPKHNFFSANATYCASTDPVCTQCRVQFDALYRSSRTVGAIGSQFCVGDGGCVCVAVCEVPQLLAIRAADTSCGREMPKYKDPDGPELMAFSKNTRRDPRAPLVGVLKQTTDETCGYHGELDVQGCRRPRSCHECLVKEGCMISEFSCTSMSTYNTSLDFREATYYYSNMTTYGTSETVEEYQATRTPGQPSRTWFMKSYYQFPSTNTTYCPTSDASCVDCRERFKKNADAHPYAENDHSELGFCIGDSGCVCIEWCENELMFLKDTNDPDCRTTGDHNSAIIVWVFAIALGVAGFSWLARSAWKAYTAESERVERERQDEGHRGTMLRNMIDTAPALHLDLYGWRHFQRQLLAKEEELLAGAEDVSPVSRPVDFDFVHPTAPDFDEDEASAPTVTNPTALASAPTLVRRRSRWRLLQTSGGGMEDASVPSAPDFDEE